jgi:predicted PurR-regulated permease PerM
MMRQMHFYSLYFAVVIALTQSWTLALITLVYTIIVDCIEGYVLSPRIMGRAVEIRQWCHCWR